jgi:hypothetical protein
VRLGAAPRLTSGWYTPTERMVRSIGIR